MARHAAGTPKKHIVICCPYAILRNAIVGYTERVQELVRDDGNIACVPDLEEVLPSAEHQLGLAISRKFCQLRGGDIMGQSEAGKGSTFTVTLPQRVPENGIENREL